MNNADAIVRLTEKRNGENVIPLRSGVGMPEWELYRKGCIETVLSGDAADRLAAYEDTGLTPHQIKVLQEMAGKDADERVRLRNKVVSLQADLARVTAERDAAVGDLTMICINGETCAACVHCCNKGDQFPCAISNDWCGGEKWQWRGVKGEQE